MSVKDVQCQSVPVRKGWAKSVRVREGRKRLSQYLSILETASICSDSQFSSVRKTVSDCRDSQHASAGHKCPCVSVCTSP